MLRDEYKISINQPLLVNEESKLVDPREIKNILKKQVRMFRQFYALVEIVNPFIILEPHKQYENLFKNLIAAHVTIIVSFLPAEALIEFSLVNKSIYSLSAEYLKLPNTILTHYLPNTAKSAKLLESATTALPIIERQKNQQDERGEQMHSRSVQCYQPFAGTSLLGMVVTGIWLAVDSSARNFSFGPLTFFIAFSGLCVITCVSTCSIQYTLTSQQEQRKTEYESFCALISEFRKLTRKTTVEGDSKEFKFAVSNANL